MKYYGTVGLSDTHEDATENPVCPDGMIEMEGPHPANGEYIADSNGRWVEKKPTADEIAKQKKEEWKADRQEKVDAIVVEIDGMKFDGDELSQGRMARAAGLAETPDETVRWILADNTVADVTADQLKRAARAAGREQEKLWIPQPEHNPPPDDGSDP